MPVPQEALLRLVVFFCLCPELTGCFPDSRQQLLLPSTLQLVHQQMVHLPTAQMFVRLGVEVDRRDVLSSGEGLQAIHHAYAPLSAV